MINHGIRVSNYGKRLAKLLIIEERNSLIKNQLLKLEEFKKEEFYTKKAKIYG